MKWQIFKPKTIAADMRRADPWILWCVVGLVSFGLLMVYNSSVALAISDFADPYYYVKVQAKWLILGLIGLLAAAKVDYHRWYNLSVPFLLLVLGLLVLVFLPGIGVSANGAHRWINLGFTVLQPAELAKLSLVTYLSAWFSTKEKGRLGAFLLLMTMVLGLVILEPDLGTAIIIMVIAMMLYFYSGAPLGQFVALGPVVAIAVFGLIIVSPYRFQRLLTFLNPESDPQGASYHIRQATLALGSGGWFGVGLGQSRQKYEYLPEANTDSIFAIIGEELGFVGSVVVITIFLFLLWRGVVVATKAPDQFGKLLGLGVISWIGVQTIMNIGAIAAVIPLTGVPLPFISYGGSSLVVMLFSVGILLNISRQTKGKI